MKKLITLSLLLMAYSYLFANPIDEPTAKKVAINFFATKVGTNKLGVVSNLQMVYTAKDAIGNNCFYVFNVSNAKGYIIIAADDASKPVLGYSDESNFDIATEPLQLKNWFNSYTKQISSAIINKVIATDAIKSSWNTLINPPTRKTIEEFGISANGTTVVAPLLKVFWNQPSPYNNLCPYDSVGGGRSVTGCVATAMAQVMKYWSYPTKGIGSNSYTPSGHTYEGVQAVNFDSTTYLWDSMPDFISSATSANQIKAIATLMYSCGVSVNMDYSSSGSGAHGSAVSTSLVKYFGYDPDVQVLDRSSHTDAEWISIIQNELSQGRPVVYTGQDTATDDGHCFITDGYDANNYFHFNWGWGGLDNGYFMIDSLNPGTGGTGAGSGKYNESQSITIGIQPPVTASNLTLDAKVAVTPTSISPNGAFSVSTDVRNDGTAIFKGDIGAAVYDDSLNFISYIQILSNKSLATSSHYTNNLTFSTTGISNMVPGTYYVGIISRPSGGAWTTVAPYSTYKNFTKITVVNPTTDLLLSDSIVATPSSLIEGSSAKISFNIINQSVDTFFGKYSVALYNLDGSFAQAIGSYNETNGLLSGKQYTSPLVFNVDSIGLKPGTYILEVRDSSYDSTSSEYVGNGEYLNPILISVLPPALIPDKYEPNNTLAQSYLLPLNFINDTANTNTAGTNITASNLKDYFKIALPAGYNYIVNIAFDNANYNTTDSAYTLDGLFAYSTNAGSTWTTERTNTITLTEAGSKTLYLRVAPSLASPFGEIGTYMLELNVIRSYPLPVVFSIVNVNKVGTSNVINWEVTDETNLASYNVERSYDGNEFSVVGTTKANPTNIYSFEDNTFNNDSPTIYYRIVAIDKTGYKTYSNVVSVELSNVNYPLSIYPNPVKDFLNMQLNSGKAKNITIQVLDMSGRVLNTKQTLLNAGTNNLSLPITNLANGSYIVVVKGEDGTIGQKQFVKY